MEHQDGILCAELVVAHYKLYFLERYVEESFRLVLSYRSGVHQVSVTVGHQLMKAFIGYDVVIESKMLRAFATLMEG